MTEKICKGGVCSECFGVLCVTYVHHQADVCITVWCDTCKTVTLDNRPESTISDCKNTYVVTLMLVYVVMCLGWGYSGAEKLCGMLSMRHFTRDSYIRYANYVIKKGKECVHNVLEQCRKAVFRFYAEELGRTPDENGVLDVDVGFDGTWHTRGHRSLLGAGAVIDQNTGLVLDYETLSKVCAACTSQETKYKNNKVTKEAYEKWKADHAPFCDMNFEGAAGGMEAAEALACWKRSLQHNMRYINFVGDGDSSAYNAVKESGVYGEKQIEKWECVNHVAKRLGTGLRNLCKQTVIKVGKGKSTKTILGGKNKLTGKVIENLQFYFGLSIKRKVNTTPEEMKNEVMSSFYHCSSTDTDLKHDLCPLSNDSWCFYQKAIANGEKPPSHKTMKVHFTLPDEQLELVKEVYERLSSNEMMQRCLRGLTQNPNESFHSRIWRYCPKHVNATKKKLDFATAHATCDYNVGYVSSNLHQLLGLPYTSILHTYLERKDKLMNLTVKKKMRHKRPKMDISYSPGGHRVQHALMTELWKLFLKM